METNGISGGMYSSMSGGSAMLGLEMSSNHRHQQQQQNPNFLHRHQQPPFTADHRHPPPAAKQAYPFSQNPRTSPLSDDDDPHTNNNNHPTTTEDSGGDGKMRKGSPWQRMKWTDNMVRLLIMVVFYIGDEAGSDPSGSDPSAKKKGGGGGGAGAGGGGVLQKKGKWKSVSNAMMERGFCVSPQQCEDKFNDLNKRYKRVNDILGKGIACKVVENQSLLETMDHLSTKTKEEVKKLLNSKHLFFREMCAYHNSCATNGAGGGTNGGGHHSPPPEVVQPVVVGQPQSYTHQCVHSSDKNAMISCSNDEEEDEEEDGGTHEGRSHYNQCEDEDEEEDDGLSRRKRGRMNENVLVKQFSGEVMNVVQDLTKSVREKRQWMKRRMMQLEEQRLGFEGEAYELEKQRLKWVKFSYKKERDMEVEKLRNERMRLENDRMVILLRQRELELMEQQQYSSTIN